MAAASPAAATTLGLLHRTDTIGLTVAALLPRACVMAITSAMRRKHVWERFSIADFVGVYTITNPRTVLHRIDEDADDGA